MKTYSEYLNEQKKDTNEKKDDKYIELGIGDREKKEKKEENEHIELGIGDRER